MITILSILAAAILMSLWLYQARRARLRNRSQHQAEAALWDAELEAMIKRNDEIDKEFVRDLMRHEESLRIRQPTQSPPTAQLQKPRNPKSASSPAKTPRAVRPNPSPKISQSQPFALEQSKEPTVTKPQIPLETQVPPSKEEPTFKRDGFFQATLRPFHFAVCCLRTTFAPIMRFTKIIASFFTRPKPPPAPPTSLDHRRAA